MIRAAARLGASALSLVVLVTAIFFVVHATPGGPAYAILGLKATPDSVQKLDQLVGLNTPLWWQFLLWWGHFLTGNLGQSYVLNRPVAALLAEYAANSLALYGLVIAVSAMAGLAAGLVHGVFWQRWPGRMVGGLEIGFYALPGFFIGTVLIAVFSIRLGWLPASGMADIRADTSTWADQARHLVLPVLAAALFGFAPLSRIFAQSVHMEHGRDYARSAAAKGVPPWRILFRHVVPNALRPFVTMLGLSFPALISSVLVVEAVFGYPGLGWLLWRAAVQQDYPVIVGVVLVAGVVTIVANLMADLVNRWLDPRLR